MTKEQFDNILQRYLRDQCTAEEIRFVENWIENIQQSADELTIPDDKKEIIRDKIWANMSFADDQVLADSPTNNGLSSWKWARRIAASIALIAASVFLFYKYSDTSTSTREIAFEDAGTEVVTYANSTNKPELIHLEDGSTVLVHPGSQIKYPKTFGNKREVSLSGEAFFQVAKDPQHPFYVYSNEVTTRVLGTSFLIKAYEHQENITVSVNTGRVSVTSKPPVAGTESLNEELILTPNQQAIYLRDKGTVEKQLVDNPRVLHEDEPMDIAYTNEPATKLFKTLERMYGVTIKYDEGTLANCNITTELTNEGLFERMDVICLVLGAKYRVEDAVIIVESGGCSD